MAPIPPTMKSWIIARQGDPKDALELKTEWPSPKSPTGGNILIKVSHAVINPMDLVVLHMPRYLQKKAVPAVDFAGEVIEVGPSVASASPDIRVGMTVCGTLPTAQILWGYGTLSEYIVVPAHAVAEKPQGFESGLAGALMGIAGQTTAVLVRTANVSKGDRVLVNGASGGVGVFVVQVLRAKGVHVTAICSGRNEAMVRRLGADEVVDYTVHESLYDYLSNEYGDRPFDVILDCVGVQELSWRSAGYLKPDGKALSIKGGPLRALKAKLPLFLGGAPRVYWSISNWPSGAGARETADWFRNGVVEEVPIDSTFEFGDAVQALEKLATKHASGKIIIKVP